MVDSPQAAIRLWINHRTDGYHLFHAARADLLRRVGGAPELQSTGTNNDSERRFLERHARSSALMSSIVESASPLTWIMFSG